MRNFLLLIIYLSFSQGQVKPSEDLHINYPRTWALNNGIIHTEPGKVIKNGTIILRNGIIEAAGENIKIPPDATKIDLNGKHVYAGFIESWLDADSVQTQVSLRDHWNVNMAAYKKIVDYNKPDKKSVKELRALGFTTAHLVPQEGIFQGQSGLVQLGDQNRILNHSQAQVINFHYGGWGSKEYPTSLLGSIAFIRQGLYDADWYGKTQNIIALHPQGNEPPKEDRSLAELYQARKNEIPFIFRAKSNLYSLRAKKIALEFELNMWLKGNGYEYRQIEEIKSSNAFLIIPLNYPGKPHVSQETESLQYSTRQLKHWDMAPDNAIHLSEAGIKFSFTTAGLHDKQQFRNNLSMTVIRGFDQAQALAALTVIPAEKFGESKRLGKILPGFIGNLTIVEGDYFNKESIVRSVWINGKEYKTKPEQTINPAGSWTILESGRLWNLSLREENHSFSGELILDSLSFPLDKIVLDQDRLSFTIKDNSFFQTGVTRFAGTILEQNIQGHIIYADGSSALWSGVLDSAFTDTINNLQTEEKSALTVFSPEGAFGRSEKLTNPNIILVNDATIWTSGPQGILKGWDILFENGRVKKIARNISVGRSGALVIEGYGKHITPGLIDAHSHMAGASINEGFQSVTAEVRMEDVIVPDDINLYRSLSGGLTIINLLHGSANAIGGQNAVLKLRWGSSNPGDLIYEKATPGIKFALGENVKRSNYEAYPKNRYPKTRLGVEQIIRDAFEAARDYQKSWNIYNKNSRLKITAIPPRKDLELDALVEILEGKRKVHCHSYRQDEILMLTRIAEDFGFTIGTFQHVLEGYKIAERIKEHGANASTFSDWWAYKYEVIDAIPYNGALMHAVGVNVSFNSDDDELSRRMNLEAAKAVKYGNLSPQEALNFVTINPAKQLGIDKWVGSLEPGKEADFVIWSGNPLSNYSRCEQTWINGIQYFSLNQNSFLQARDAKLRNDLIQKILSSENNGNTPLKPDETGEKEKYSCFQIDKAIQNGGF